MRLEMTLKSEALSLLKTMGVSLHPGKMPAYSPVSYTHLRAHETVLDLVCRLLLEKKKTNNKKKTQYNN